MEDFKSFITEKYVNLFQKDQEEKREYVAAVWDMVQKSYAPVGGIKGSGFTNKEDMIQNIPFWKVIKKNGTVVAALLYKDKSGRKRVATCSDGSLAAKKLLANAMKQEAKRGYFEVSKASWGFIRKLLDQSDLVGFMIDPTTAGKYLKKDIIELGDLSVAVLDAAGLNPNDPANKPYKDFIYGRKLGGSIQAKLMIGSLGKSID